MYKHAPAGRQDSLPGIPVTFKDFTGTLNAIVQESDRAWDSRQYPRGLLADPGWCCDPAQAAHRQHVQKAATNGQM